MKSRKFSHWWHVMMSLPESIESDAYRRLKRVWFDQTRFRGTPLSKTGSKDYLANRSHEFVDFGHETHLTTSLWENFSIFECSLWLPNLFELAGLGHARCAPLRCNWSYEWEGYRPDIEKPGKKRQGMCDVVVEYEAADNSHSVLVIEAKSLGKALGGKEQIPEYYLALDGIAEFEDRKWLIYLVDEVVLEKCRGMTEKMPANVGLLTWQQLGALQISLAKQMDLSPVMRNFVASAIQFQFLQNGIRPCDVAIPYLEAEPGMIEIDAIPRELKQNMSEHSVPLWKIS